MASPNHHPKLPILSISYLSRFPPPTASNGPSVATFDDVPGLSAVHMRLMTPSYTLPQFSLPGIRDPQGDYPFESLSVQCGTTPSNSNTSIQRPLARHRVMLSRRVIADYGLLRASESLPAAYGFAAGAAAPKENGLRWESRGSPIDSAGLCSRAASHTPATRRVRLTVSSSSVFAFTPVSRVRRHMGSFEAAEFTHSQVRRNCYGPRAG